jgi:sarcosine oxidase
MPGTKTAYDYIVVGCGGIGSAALYWLSRLPGAEILGLEQFQLGHERGASQDHSRIIRFSYHDPAYVALAAGSYAAWREIEEESGVRVVLKTGGLDLEQQGTIGAMDLAHCAAALDQFGVAYERLDASEIRARWPQFQIADDVHGLFQIDGGLVDPGKANAVHQRLACAHGVTIFEDTPVRAIQPVGEYLRVVTDQGNYTARGVVVAADAWTNQVLGSLGIQWPLTTTLEQVTYFATPQLRDFAPERFPVWIWRAAESYYGFPVYGEVATKAGQDVGGEAIAIDERTFEPNPAAAARLRRFLDATIPTFLGPELYTKTCLYTMPPDRDFILDRLPEQPNVVVAVGAGHAYKFAGLLGQILSELVAAGATEYPIQAFGIDRPALTDPGFVPIFRNEAVLARDSDARVSETR